MNYYPHHIGDYLRDTAHLTMIEDGAYRRLIDLYYQHEQPLPSDKRQVYRLSRAATPAERKAIDTILSEYFTQTPEGFRHSRCDNEIADYQERSSDEDARKENEKERQRRHRERRKELFAALREHDVVPAWDTKTTDLETLLSRYQSRPVTRDSPVSVTGPATAIPITNSQEPITKEEAAAASPPPTRTHAHEASDDPPPLPSSEPSNPTSLGKPAGYAVLIRRWEKARGKASTVTSSDPRLAVWAEKDVTEPQLREAYDLAVADRELAQDPGPINAGFLDVFLAKVLKPPGGDSALNRQSSAVPPKHWAVSWSGIVAKGEELGIVQESGELAPTFKARVFAAAQLSEGEKAMLRADYGVSV